MPPGPNFIKKKLQHRCFPANANSFLRTPILKNICEECARLTKRHKHIFSFSLKSGVYYIAGKWGEFVKNVIKCFHILFWYFFFVFIFLFFIIKLVCFYHFHVCFFLTKYQISNIKLSDKWIGGFQLSVELYANCCFCVPLLFHLQPFCKFIQNYCFIFSSRY